MTCRTIAELLSPYLDGELDPARRLAVDGHLRGCPACRAALQAQRRLDAALRQLPAPDPAPSFGAEVMGRLAGPRRRWQPLPAAAYLLLFAAVFSAGFFLSDRAPAVAGSPAPAEISLGDALAESRSMELLAVHDQTLAAIEEAGREE